MHWGYTGSDCPGLYSSQLSYPNMVRGLNPRDRKIMTIIYKKFKYSILLNNHCLLPYIYNGLITRKFHLGKLATNHFENVDPHRLTTDVKDLEDIYYYYDNSTP